MTSDEGRRPATRGIALALSGGAARGWAHLGVLRALEEEGIAVGAIAGTSMGALAALAFAAGRLDALEAIARTATSRTVLARLDPSFGRGAWLGGRRIARDLERHFGALRLDELAVPTALVAADIATAEEVRLRSGPAVAAVRASMALPGIFPPVAIDGRLLVDGGMVANLPLAAARALAPGLPLVAVDVMGDYAGGVATAPARSAAASVRAAFLMLIAGQTRAAVAACPPHCLLTLPTGAIGAAAFTRARDLIALGRAAVHAALPRLRDLTA